MDKTSIEKACEAVGGQARLAASLGLTTQAVHLWVKAKKVPAERVLSVETATGVSRHDLRPDIYPREERAA